MQLFPVIFLFAALALLPGAERGLAPEGSASDTLRPEISFSPKEIIVDQPASGFVVEEVTVLNRGTLPLQIHAVTPSCGCAGATVLENPVQPMNVGKIRLSVNTKSFTDSLNRVEFLVQSNAENGTVPYYLIVRKKSGTTK